MCTPFGPSKIKSSSNVFPDLICQSIKQNDGSHLSQFIIHGQLIETIFDDVHTLYEAFQRGARLSEDGPCLGYKPSPTKPFTWISYSEVLRRSEFVGAGLISLGLPPGNATYVGVYSQNRPEYVLTDLGLWTYSMVAVPLYDTLGVEACNHIINQAELSVVVCDTIYKVQSLLSRHSQTPTLKTLVLMEKSLLHGMLQDMAIDEIKLCHFEKLESLGKANPVPKKLPSPDDLSIICFTSGTTGVPKGAMLTHKGFVAVGCCALQQLKAGGIECNPGDVMISYLPMAHSYEQALHALASMSGSQIGFFQGEIDKLMDDIKELKPTIFPCVPCLLNRFYDKVLLGASSSALKKLLFNMALHSKRGELRRRIIRKDSFWDMLVFHKIHAMLGGRVRVIVTGSAPLSPEVLAFLRCVVGCPLLEGYGQTENHATCCLQLIGDDSVGTVGPPMSCSTIKLVDIPEMDYRASENKGEVCIKGPNVFKGYLKDKDKTDEVLDEEGWLHTGDVGQWTQVGSLKIIDRKKHIFKLSHGEYIAPEKIENVFIQSLLVAQIYVHGESLKSSVVAIVVPDEQQLMKYAKYTLHIDIKDTFAVLCQMPEVRCLVLKKMNDLGRSSGLSSLEIVRDVYLHPEPFSVENGLLTPTFKSKRQELAKFFKPQIDAMYMILG